MARYTGSLHEQFTVKAAPSAVRDQFVDLDQIVAQFGDLDSAEQLDAETLRFVMKEQNHGVFTFQGRYDCRYQADGEHAAHWKSQGEGGNVWTEGKLTVAPGDKPGTTRLDYQAEMTLEIDVNAMLAPILEPVVRASIPGQMRDYIKRMIKAVEAA